MGAILKQRQFKTFAAILALILSGVTAPCLAGDPDQDGKLGLSPELAGLLRAEMTELSEGVRTIALSLAAADWGAIQETSGKMHESYIMKKSLTPSLAAELKQKLPHEFKRLDAAFHARALKLRHAAENNDFELSAFHFSKLVESCAGCHSKFAVERFPGFKKSTQERHEH